MRNAIYQTWQDNLTHVLETIIKECTAILDIYDKEHNLPLAAKQFVSLSETYARLSSDSPTSKRISEELKSITDAYIKDEDFIKKIENSRSSEASQRLAQEIQTRQRSKSHDMGREI